MIATIISFGICRVVFRVYTNRTTFPSLVVIPSGKEEVSSATGSLSEDKVKSVEAALDKGNNSAKSSC
jgi:hypothetical protein